MPTYFKTWAALVALLLFYGVSPVHAVTVAVDTNTRYQTIDGFGTCTYLYDTTTEANYTTSAFQNMYAQDLGSSIMRMEIAPDVQETADLDLNNLNTNLLNFNVNSTNTNGPVMQAINARKLDTFKIYGTPWTPPGWMKDNNSDVNGGHLRADRRDHFGKYLAAYCTKWQQTYGIPIYAVSIQNELEFSQSFNSCLYTPQELTATIKAVKAQFQKWGITTKLEAPEDLGGGQYWDDRSMTYVYDFMNDPAAASAIDIINIHGYGSATTNSSSSAPDASVDFHNRIQGWNKPLWQTETSGDPVAWLNADGTPGALQVGVNIHTFLANGGGTAWLYWQVCDPTKTVYALTDDTNDTTAGKYNASKHFYRYIRPGAVRVGCTGSNNSNFYSSAYVHDGNKSLTVVLINTSAGSQPVTVTVPSYPAISSFAGFQTSSTQSFASLGSLPVSGGQITLTMPADSMVTLYGTGTGSTPTLPGRTHESCGYW